MNKEKDELILLSIVEDTATKYAVKWTNKQKDMNKYKAKTNRHFQVD